MSQGTKMPTKWQNYFMDKLRTWTLIILTQFLYMLNETIELKDIQTPSPSFCLEA